MRSLFKLKVPVIFTLFLGITILIYGTVISGPFLFDDNLLIELNLLIRSLDNFSVFSRQGEKRTKFYKKNEYEIEKLNMEST